jgi:hypothetical protein
MPGSSVEIREIHEMADVTDGLVEHFFRHEYGRLVALLSARPACDISSAWRTRSRPRSSPALPGGRLAAVSTIPERGCTAWPTTT